VEVKWKAKNITPSEQFQKSNRKIQETEVKLIPLRHIHVLLLSLYVIKTKISNLVRTTRFCN